MNILFLRGFNNYHKRTIIKFSSLSEYQARSASYLNYEGINFNPNDGVVTDLVVGSTNQKENSKYLDFDENGSPDYLICYEVDATTKEAIIKSRWFVLESVRVRAGQYHLALKRDVMADNMDWLKTSSVFVEKGIIFNEYSPFIFNSENMTYNQIKKKEIPLYDNTGTSWIVGYIAKNYTPENDTGKDLTATITNSQAEIDAEDVEDLFGSLTDNDIAQGITRETIHTLNMLFKTQANVENFDIGTNYFTAGRVKISIANNGIYTIDTNHSVYYDVNSKWSVYEPSFMKHIRHLTGMGLGPGVYSGFDWFVDNTVFPISHYIHIGRSNKNYMPNVPVVDVATDWANSIVSGDKATDRVTTEFLALNQVDSKGLDGFLALNGKSVSRTVGGVTTYYSLRITHLYDRYDVGSNIIDALSASTRTALNNNLLDILAYNKQDFMSGYQWRVEDGVYVSYDTSVLRIEFVQIPATLTVKVNMPKRDDRWGCNDQLFDIFCIPFGEIYFDKNDNTTFLTRKDAALAAARAMATELGSNLYDLQILPYCPIRTVREAYEVYSRNWDWVSDGDGGYEKSYHEPVLEFSSKDISGSHFQLTLDALGQWDEIVDNGDNTKWLGVVLWASDSTGTIDVPISSRDTKYYQYDMDIANSFIQKKLSNETEVFRLCSPNYNGLFEYSAAKNDNKEVKKLIRVVDPGGSTRSVEQIQLDYINVDYTYRPGNPYIHLNPIFKDESQGGIYGKDWNDARGLICGGDFSLGYIVDAFRSYQIQNANFQNIFDRQIQNLDVMNALQYEQTQFASALGAIGMPIGGATSGALAGAKAGPYGAIAGAAIGGSAGLIGGVIGYEKTMEWLERQQQETRSYTKDMYNYTLGNIKALPYSISKTDCLTANSRLVPFLEVYQATQPEVNNLLTVMKYDGMTVMTINTLSTFMGRSDNPIESLAVMAHDQHCYFVKGRLIMNEVEDFVDDFHVLDAIYAELSKGVYLQEEIIPVEEPEEEEEDNG